MAPLTHRADSMWRRLELRALAIVALALALCGGAVQGGPATFAELEPNDTVATATPIDGTAAVLQGDVMPAGDVDYFGFTAAAGDRVYAAVMTSYSAGAPEDSRLSVRDADDGVVESDEDDGSFGPTSSSIAGAVLPSSGTHYLRVEHGAGGQLRPYRLFLQLRSGTPVPETEDDDLGHPLPAGGWVSGAIGDPSDVDVFGFELAAGDTVFVSLDLDPERDGIEWNGRLGLGPFGSRAIVRSIDDPGTAAPDSEAFPMTVKASGSFHITIDSGQGASGSYHLSATVLPAADEGFPCSTHVSTDVPVEISAFNTGTVTSTLTVPGDPRIADLDVALRFHHTRMNDLDVSLTAPNGNVVPLFTDVGSSSGAILFVNDTVIDEEGALPIDSLGEVFGPQVAPEAEFRTSWFDGQPGGGTWTLTVRDDTADEGGTLTAWSLRICEPPPPAACPVDFALATVLATDFNSGPAGFTSSGVRNEWELGLPTSPPVTGCHSGSQCWKTDLDGLYDSDSSQDLLSPPIDLAGLWPPVVVRWAQKYQMDDAALDGLLIEAREVGNPARRQPLFRWTGAVMETLVGSPAQLVKSVAGWGQHSARIDSFAGAQVELRFHLDSTLFGNFPGLAIDDVSVTACVPLPGLVKAGFEPGDLSEWSTWVPVR